MITCHECIDALSTTRLADIRPGSPVALHYARCERCSAMVQDLYHAERDLAGALDRFQPATTPEEIAERAIESRFRARRRIARVIRAVLALAAVGVSLIGLEVLLDEPSTIEERYFLTCIAPSRASTIAEGYMTSGGTIEVSEDERSILLRGTYDEVKAAESQIRTVDNSGSCDVPNPATGVIAPGSPDAEVIVNPPEDFTAPAPAPADKSGTD